MDPFHVVALAGTKLDLCRQRVQQQTCGHRGRSGDPLYRVRRTLRTRLPLLSTRQQAPADRGVRRRRPPLGRADLERLPAHHRRLQPTGPPPRQNHDDQRSSTPCDAACPPDWKNSPNSAAPCTGAAHDVLAYFDHHASNGPTEAINGRLEALRRNALGFRNLTHYRIRSLPYRVPSTCAVPVGCRLRDQRPNRGRLRTGIGPLPGCADCCPSSCLSRSWFSSAVSRWELLSTRRASRPRPAVRRAPASKHTQPQHPHRADHNPEEERRARRPGDVISEYDKVLGQPVGRPALVNTPVTPTIAAASRITNPTMTIMSTPLILC